MKIFLAVFIVFSAFLGASAQTKVVTGKVISAEDNQPAPGVNVIVKGTSKGTGTDADGNYKIELTEGETTLEFTFIGYKTVTEIVGERTVIDVVMATDAKELEEVVVVGYGIQRKTDITGATGSVKGEDLYRQPVLTAAQAVQGKIAGVQIISSGQPGSAPQVRIRGVGTALGNTTALYVVDGVLTDDITNINTNDIADINVLKDASAAAIYGSRGANGVIIITTKRGSGQMKVSYSNNVGFRQAANLVPMANSAEYGNYYQAATGKVLPATPYSTDWYGSILRNAMEQTHNVTISGSTDKNNYLLNVGYLNDEGIVLENSFKRLTVRLNEEYKISDKVKVGILSSYGNSVNQNGFSNIDIDAFGNVGGVYNDAYRASPTIPDVVGGRYGNTSAFQNVGNPVLDLKSNSIKVKEDRLQGSGFLEVKPVSWVTLRTAISADLRNSVNRGYYRKFLADETTYVVAGGNQLSPRSSLNMKETQQFRWVWDNTATFAKTLGSHDFTLVVGTTAEKYQNTMISASRKDVPADPNLWYINVGDANSSQNDGSGDGWARNSYLSRLNYSYQGKYLLTATYRRDGSSRLPSQNRWQNYPSVGVAWVLSREAFMNGQNLFDLLKLRASYGKVGNDQIPTNAFTKVVAINLPYPYGGNAAPATSGDQIREIIPRNITWEITREYDLALEFSMLDARLSGEVNYYDKLVDNALIKVLVPGTAADYDQNIITNAASISNKGLEVSLNWKDKINDNLSYTIGGNVTFNKNEVLKLNGGQAISGGGVGSQGLTTLTDNGHSVGSFYVLKQIGVFNSDAEIAAYANNGIPIQGTAHPGDFKYQDTNGDGVISLADRVFAGSYQPVAYYGINLGVNFKRWDFNMSIYGNAGNKVYNGKRGARVLGSDNIEKDLVYSRWTASNQSQTQPGANIGSLPASTYFVESGSFARINNLTIGYAFTPEGLKKIGLTNLRIYATSQNLFTYKKYSGFTAELPGDPISSGIELSAYPTTRTIALGLNIGF